MKGLEMVKCESLRINMFRITHTRKVSKFSRNIPPTLNRDLQIEETPSKRSGHNDH